MKKYELTFLLKKSEDAQKIKQLLTLEEGKLLKEEKWGEKTLAYQIKKNRTAFFYNWLIEIPQNKIGSFRKKLNFEEKILRYLLLVS
ncbi:MAG: 30S ribosomal protein S6 [Microgenomates group bacterium]